MLPLFTRAEMRELDRAAVESSLVPSVLLMENAGLGATLHLLESYRERLERPLIVGGEGQNGGDAWVVARQLVTRGIRPRCVLVGRAERVAGDARVNLDALRALAIAIEVIDATNVESLAPAIAQATSIVDGLFGTGLARPVESFRARAIELLNAAQAPICALDLPSGIDADSGAVLGAAVRARSTVTFAGLKRGLHQYPGAEHAGTVVSVPIGVPPPADANVAVIEARDVAGVLVPLRGDAHKGTRGHTLVIAGSEGKTGAALLAALGALRAGAGLATIAADAATQASLEQRVLEVMTTRLDASDLLGSALAVAEGKASVALGPGFGLSPERRAAAARLVRELPVPTVVDADALTAVAGNWSELRAARAPRVLTPHPGEAARLLAISSREIQADRYHAARELAERSGQVVVLKGARTIVASPQGRMYVCAEGTPALGVAGTGDVLSGAIAALLSQLSPFEAAWGAVFLHARAGMMAAESDRGLLASEVARALPSALARLRDNVRAGA